MRHVLFPTTFQGFPGKHNHVGYPLASSPHLLTPPGCPLLLRGLEGKVPPSPKVYMLHQAESGRLGDQGATFLNLDFLCACTKHVTFLLPACSFRGGVWGGTGPPENPFIQSGEISKPFGRTPPHRFHPQCARQKPSRVPGIPQAHS